MAQLNIRIDDQLKEQAELLFNDLGISFSSAISLFIRQSVREGGIPFAITTKTDQFYSEINQAVLRASIANLEAGRGVVRKTIEELEALENA